MTSTKDVEAALTRVLTGGEIEVATPALNVILDKLERAVAVRVFQKLNGGETLDPTYAVQAWLELFAFHRTRSRLTKSVTVGQSAGETISEQMDNGE